MRRGDTVKGKHRPQEGKAEYCTSCKRKYTRKNPRTEDSQRCSECTAILLGAYMNWESLRSDGRTNLPHEQHRERTIEILRTIASFEAPLPTRLYDYKNLT